MVLKYVTKNGVRYHKPPYTKAEEDDIGAMPAAQLLLRINGAYLSPRQVSSIWRASIAAASSIANPLTS